MNEKLLTLPEVAYYLGVPLATIYTWRSANPPRGPRGIRVGRHIRVRETDLVEWLAANTDPEPDSARHTAASPRPRDDS